MGTVYAEITLKNAFDVTNAHRGIIGEADIHQAAVTAVVDTGAGTLIINEEMRERLGLEMRGTTPTRLADNTAVTMKVTEPVEVHWKDRSMTCQPWVITDSDEILLGAIPLENMDLIVDPSRETLIGAHGDKPLFRV